MGRMAIFAAILFCIILLGAQVCGAAQYTPDFAAIDKQISATPKSAETSVKTLGAYLNSLCKNDLEKTRAIYDWITLNIDYDSIAFTSGNLGNQEPVDILKVHKATCNGYANLFGALAKIMNLEQVVIAGYSRGIGYTIGKRSLKANHAWNAVKIDGTWRLIDSAWGAGYLDSKYTYFHDRNYHYFLTKPEQFISDHFPEDPKWQLLDDPIDINTYDKRVCLKRLFFDYNLELISNRDAHIAGESKLQLSLGVPNDVLITAEVYEANAKCEDVTTLVNKTDGQAMVYVSFQKTGKYLMHLYAAHKSAVVDKYDLVATYAVEVNSIAKANTIYPNACDPYYANCVFLDSPMDAEMGFGKSEIFKLTAPNAEDVQVIVGSKWYKLEKNGDTFEGKAEMDGNLVSIGVKYPEKSQYVVIVEYKVFQNQTSSR